MRIGGCRRRGVESALCAVRLGTSGLLRGVVGAGAAPSLWHISECSVCQDFRSPAPDPALLFADFSLPFNQLEGSLAGTSQLLGGLLAYFESFVRCGQVRETGWAGRIVRASDSTGIRTRIWRQTRARMCTHACPL
jgi:hypothetical protein